jgi:hypothetical protein
MDRRAKTLWIGIAAALWFQIGTAHAQTADAPGAALRRIEVGINDILRTRRAAAIEDGDLEAYAQAIYDDFKRVAAPFDENAPKATAASVAALRSFEAKAKSHHRRMQAVVTNMAKAGVGMQRGTILFTPETIRNMSPQDVDELKEGLQPNIRQRYERLNPKFGSIDHLRFRSFERATCSECTRIAGLPNSDDSLMSRIADLLVPKAQASVAVGCYFTCAASLGSACFGCVASASVGAVEMWDWMKGGLKRCNKKTKWFGVRAMCKAAYIGAFLSYLA